MSNLIKYYYKLANVCKIQSSGKNKQNTFYIETHVIEQIYKRIGTAITTWRTSRGRFARVPTKSHDAYYGAIIYAHNRIDYL